MFCVENAEYSFDSRDFDIIASFFFKYYLFYKKYLNGTVSDLISSGLMSLLSNYIHVSRKSGRPIRFKFSYNHLLFHVVEHLILTNMISETSIILLSRKENVEKESLIESFIFKNKEIVLKNLKFKLEKNKETIPIENEKKRIERNMILKKSHYIDRS